MTWVVTRATLGRLAAYSSSPVTDVSEAFVASGAQWTGSGIALVSGRLGLTSTSGTVAVLSAVVADRADVFLQARAVGSSFAQEKRVMLLGRSSADILSRVSIRYPVRDSGTQTRQLAEFNAGVLGAQDATAGVNYTAAQRVSLKISGTAAASYLHDAGIEDTISGITLAAAGKVGLAITRDDTISVSTEFDSFYAMASHLITVNGPVAGGWQARVLGTADAVLATATPTAGVATIDAFAERLIFPNALALQIWDPTESAELGRITPTSRIWGGDVYTAVAPKLLSAAFTFGVSLDPIVVRVGIPERTRRDAPRIWRTRVSRTDGLSDFAAAPLTSLAHERLTTLDGLFLETL